MRGGVDEPRLLIHRVAQHVRREVFLSLAGADVRALVFKEVGWMVLAGAVVGLPSAYGLARVSESLFFGVHAGDITVYLISLSVIVVIAAIACYVPSRRATRIDPIVALRYE